MQAPSTLDTDPKDEDEDVSASTLQSPSEALYLAFETRFSGVELFAGPAFTVIMTSFVMANTFC